MPLVLFGSVFWQGLMDWLRQSLLGNHTISEKDFDFITVTDDIEHVVAIMREHRQWKDAMRNRVLEDH